MARVDIHFHLLPGVDDGPRTMAESLELARAAVADGTRTVVATPHVRGDFLTDVSELPDRVRELRHALDRERIGLRVEAGGELGHDMVGRLSQRELERIAVGPRGRRWLLLESPWAGFEEDFHDAAEELRERGFGLVLAHPERSPGHAPGLLHELAAGALAQVNAASVTGANGEGAEGAAGRLVSGSLPVLLASDAHSARRAPMLRRAVTTLLASGVPPARVRVLSDSRSGRLLEHGMAPPARTSRRRAPAGRVASRVA